MQCPKCQTEVPSLHFYCPECRTALQDYWQVGQSERRNTINRIGSFLINLIILSLLVGGSVLVARAINWDQLIKLFSDPGVSVKSPKNNRDAGTVNTRDNRVRRKTTADSKQQNVISSSMVSVESVRDMPQNIEELPSIDEVQSPASSQVTAASRTPLPQIDKSTGTKKESDEIAEVVLDVNQQEARQGRGEGFITINSYTSAGIYINGQYSGRTPRTVKLAVGEHQIKLIADGYDDWTKTVRLKSRQQVGIMASMTRKR